MATGATDDQARDLAADLRALLEWVHAPSGGARNEVVAVPLQVADTDLDAAVGRTAGVTASFLKELVRRAVLEALHEQDPLTAVTAAHLGRALDDLLDSTQQVTRTLLGIGAEGAEPAADVDVDGGFVAVPGLAPGPIPRLPRRYR